MTAADAALIALCLVTALFAVVVLPWLLRRSSVSDRRDWPSRILRDYETERVRDHFFARLTLADVEWLVSQGWRPPAAVADLRASELEMLALSRMSEEERASVAKLRAAGVHVTAHPRDLLFEV